MGCLVARETCSCDVAIVQTHPAGAFTVRCALRAATAATSISHPATTAPGQRRHLDDRCIRAHVCSSDKTMCLFRLLVVMLLASLTFARRMTARTEDPQSLASTTTSTLNTTLTVTRFVTTTTDSVTHSEARSTSALGSEARNYGSFIVFASRPGSPVDLLRIEAAGYKLFLGGEAASYCPTRVQNNGGCPPGNYTAISSCAMVSSWANFQN